MKHLQLGWVESMTEDGEIYYFNVMTNESLWDLPAFLKVTSTQYQHYSRRCHGNASHNSLIFTLLCLLTDSSYYGFT
jgi:hypothetical protein